MKQMLAFDWELIRQKKSYCGLLAGINFIYILIGIALFHKFVYPGVVATIILTAANTYVLMSMVSCHISSHNMNVSNYSSVVYFPVKRRDFYASKAIITGCILCYQYILTVIVFSLANGIHQRTMTVQTVLPYLLGITMTVSFCSSIIAITSFSGRAFQIGSVLACTIVGMISGGFAALYADSAGDLPYISMKVTILILTISILFWLLMVLLAQKIAKKVTV